MRTPITAIDAHTAGEPLRIVTGGVPAIPGASMLEKRRYAERHLDDLRRFLMWEPRGHADMYGCLLTEPTTPDGDVGVLFLHNDGFSTMCGHGIIALVKVGLEEALFDADPHCVRIDTPAGRVTAHAERTSRGVGVVTFDNVPSFAAVTDRELEFEGHHIRYDIAFGGAFYAYVSAEALGLDLVAAEGRRIVDVGSRLKSAIGACGETRHPHGEAALEFLYGVIFVGPAGAADVHSRHACVFARGELDRSPTGTGVSGRVALMYMRGELELGAWVTVDSIIGSRFRARAVGTTRLRRVQAVIPQVSGSAHVTGRHSFHLDDADPLGVGFLIS